MAKNLIHIDDTKYEIGKLSFHKDHNYQEKKHRVHNRHLFSMIIFPTAMKRDIIAENVEAMGKKDLYVNKKCN